VAQRDARHHATSLEGCFRLEFPKIDDQRGNLTFIEGKRHIPFEIRRVVYIYDVPRGESRGAHAHKTLEQVIVCVSGGLTVHLDDAHKKEAVRLSQPWWGLYVPPMIWASEGEFVPGTVYMVLTSAYYDESDYYRDYEAFVRAVRRKQ
jgi:dTDP-4-dehydrorhamnose 3,5-epimerase-like enzyme